MGNLTIFSRLIIGVVLLGSVACGRPRSAQTVADSALNNLGCKALQSEVWNSLHQLAEEGQGFPSAQEVRQTVLLTAKTKGKLTPEMENFAEALAHYYQVTIEGIENKFAPIDLATWKKALAEMEVGVRTTEIHAQLQDEIDASLNKMNLAEASLKAECDQPSREPATDDGNKGGSDDGLGGGLGDGGPTTGDTFATEWEKLKATQAPEIYGARKTFATLYQSCDVLNLPAMSSSSPSVDGIRILSEKNPHNGGLQRVYDSLSRINASHYYIKNQRLAKSTCYEVRNTPPIYDYGGKPATSSANSKLLDMFKNGGTGTSVIGIDCSAYVFSALALAGLKLNPEESKPMRADLVHGIPSTAFKEPQNSNLKCLNKITVTKSTSILAGDIVAIKGHVIMIDAVGADPFGLARATSSAQCNSSVLTPSGFDFVISQSSPSKGSIGVNRIQAKTYLTTGTIATGLTRYAVAACRAKFGLTPNLSSPDMSVVRHSRTPQCKTTPLVAAREECVDSCRAQ